MTTVLLGLGSGGPKFYIDWLVLDAENARILDFSREDQKTIPFFLSAMILYNYPRGMFRFLGLLSKYDVHFPVRPWDMLQ